MRRNFIRRPAGSMPDATVIESLVDPVDHRHRPGSGRASLRAAAFALCLSVAGCGLLPRGMEGANSYTADSAITSRVRTAMAARRIADPATLNVETMDGVVLLTGFARSSADKDAAAAAAHQVKGVKAVRNQIVVKP